MQLAALNKAAQAHKLKTLVVYFAARDARTPWAVRLVAALVAAYAFSPIDLIPDFITVIGYLDDLLLVPLGLALVLRLTPPAVIQDATLRAEEAASRPMSYTAASVIVVLWLVMAFWLVMVIAQMLNS